MSPFLIFLVVLAAIMVLIIGAYLIAGHLIFELAFARRISKKEKMIVDNFSIKVINDIGFINEQKLEEVFIRSDDGIKLAAKYITNPIKSNRYVIFLHHYRGNGFDEFNVSAHTFYDKGFNLFFIEERGNINSGGKYFTIGPKEKEDVYSWIKYLVSQDKDSEILLFGHLMGAHIVLLALSYNLPSNVKCVIADSGYNSLDDQLLYAAHDRLKIKKAKIVVTIGETYAIFMHKMHFDETVQKSVFKNQIPVCLIHDTTDDLVPSYNLDIIYNSFDKDCYVEKHSFEGITHYSNERKDLHRYSEIITSFSEKFIK